MHEPSSVDLSQVVDEVVSRLRAFYGNRLRSVLLRYPSPGVHTEEGWDLEFFAALNGDFKQFEELSNVAAIASDVGIGHTLAIGIHPLTTQQLEDPDVLGPFFALDVREAVRVA